MLETKYVGDNYKMLLTAFAILVTNITVTKITNQKFLMRFQATPELIFWMLKSENVSEEVKEVYQEEIEYRINIFWSNLLSHLKFAQR